MNMGSLRTELDVPMGMGLRGDAHHEQNIEFDEDIMMLGSTPKVCRADAQSSTFVVAVISFGLRVSTVFSVALERSRPGQHRRLLLRVAFCRQ